MSTALRLLLLAWLVASHTAFGQCDAVLKYGIYDYKTTTSQTDRSMSLVNMLRAEEFSSFQTAKSWSSQASIPLESLMVTVGSEYSEKGWKEFRKKLETYSSLSQSERLKFQQVETTINKNVVNAWESCINSDGLHLWIETTADPLSFIVATRFRTPTGNISDVSVKSFTVTPNTVKCTSPLMPGDTIGAPHHYVACRRKSSSDNVDVMLEANFSVVGGGRRQVLSIPKPETVKKPSEQKFQIVIATGCKGYAGTDARVRVTMDGSEGSSPAIAVNNKGVNDFEKCQNDVFTLSDVSYIGTVTHVSLSHNNDGDDPGWYVKWVTVLDMATHSRRKCTFNRWLAEDETGGTSARAACKSE